MRVQAALRISGALLWTQASTASYFRGVRWRAVSHYAALLLSCPQEKISECDSSTWPDSPARA